MTKLSINLYSKSSQKSAESSGMKKGRKAEGSVFNSFKSGVTSSASPDIKRKKRKTKNFMALSSVLTNS